MLTLTINTDDIDVAKQIIAFVNSLKIDRVSVDDVNTFDNAQLLNDSAKLEKNASDWRDLIGMWEDYDLDAKDLRQQAWKRDLTW